MKRAQELPDISGEANLPPFDRKCFKSGQRLSSIGTGSPGGKGRGLALIQDFLAAEFAQGSFQGIEVGIPAMAVICTDVFDAFMQRNGLGAIANSPGADDRIAHAFQKADMPVEIVGDLRLLVAQVKTPLAIRSSSLLEDALHEPLAGIYATKMIPNNQHDRDTRFRRLVEAIKFVYASTFFKAARDYRAATGARRGEEKMAVIIQEVMGARQQDRFYPEISGVARSYNFYPTGHARPGQGVVSLALGLGKTIVDGGLCWSYSPAHPKGNPPFSSAREWLQQTQSQFWAVNMGRPPAYDPIKETEYLVRANLKDAEADNTLALVASTYDPYSERIAMGTGSKGARVLTFAPLLVLNQLPLNDLIVRLLEVCKAALAAPVEIEFALTLKPLRCGFLQVRPMVVSDAQVELGEAELSVPDLLLASDTVMGNGLIENIRDVVYVRPDKFDPKFTEEISLELESINKKLVAAGTPYLLIGFGRWGSSDPWLGIPVRWGQISGARVIVEATLPEMDKELSQGSHFFHNLTSFQICYFSVRHTRQPNIDWGWLAAQEEAHEREFVRHVRLAAALQVKVDGRSGRGVIQKQAS